MNLKMPQEYFEKRNQNLLDQIIFLLAARKFILTFSATLEGNVRVEE